MSKKNPTNVESQWRDNYRTERETREPWEPDFIDDSLDHWRPTKLCHILGEHQGLAEVEEMGDGESGPVISIYWDCCGKGERKWM